MKNVLILANGNLAKYFVEWMGKSRIFTNQYYVTCFKKNSECSSVPIENITYVDIDPTSQYRVGMLMDEIEFSQVFIVMEDQKEALFTYKNIRFIDKKIFIVLVSNGEHLDIDDENINILNSNEIMATNLYEKLPNVPLIAKNIGLGQGEIMEVLIPFGSSFAFKHVGSISHRKWRIVAIYRQEKQIFPNSATMLLPNDRLIIIGNPLVLAEVHKRVNLKQGVFPEPFGRNIYLILNMEQPKEEILLQINEAIFLSNKLIKTKLYIRLVNMVSLECIEELRTLENENIQILVTYTQENDNAFQLMDFDISKYEVGLFILDRTQFLKHDYKKYITSYKRPIYIFGKHSLFNIKEALLLMGTENEMESLSTSVFDFSESLALGLSLCDYNPEGDFEESKKIIEHYETLSRLYSFKVNIEHKRVNPIKELLNHEAILHIAPYNNELSNNSWLKFFSTNFSKHIMSIKKHPQLLIPVEK